MIRFTVAPEVLRALNVFTYPDHYTMACIHVRATRDAVMMEATNSHALLRVYPEIVFADDSERVFDVLVPITEFLPVLKAKPAKHAPKVVDIAIDGQAVTMAYAGVSSTHNVSSTAQDYPNADAIANTKPSFEPAEILGLGLPMIRNIDKALSFLGCTGVYFTAPNGGSGVFVARGESDFGLYELFLMSYQLSEGSKAEKKHYAKAKA